MPIGLTGKLESSLGRDLRELAGRQLADYDAATPGRIFSGPGPGLTVDEAYRLQIEIARLRQARGEAVAGYKVGCVSETVRNQLRVDHPVFGHVFLSEIHGSPASLDHTSFCNPAVEGEIAVTLSEDADSPEQLAAAPERFVLDWMPVIELHNYLFRGAEPSATELVSNNALHAGVVSVPGGAVAGAGNPVRIRVQINDRTHESDAYDPLATLGDLALRLAAYGIRPRRGSLLLTGSPLPLFAVQPGDFVSVSCEGLEPVKASFRAA